MRTSRKLTQSLLALFALVVMAASALAADPGNVVSPTSEVSDQKAGSILVYNYYNTGTGNNTRINITNTSSTAAAFVHLFYISQTQGCSVADNFICLTKNQTATFEMSDVDPLNEGYIVAVAVDPVFGCPVAFNHLIGDEFVRIGNDYAANLGAEAIAALYNGILPGCDANSTTAVLSFNGVVGGGYNCLPRVVAVSSLGSPDTTNTRVIINRIGGSLLTSAETIGSMFGWLFDDAENAFSYTISGGCQYRADWNATTPRLTPRLGTIIPAQRSGWTKIWANANRALLGAVLVKEKAEGGYVGGRNLHKLTLTCADGYVMPVFPPSC
jgi:hypothetical protein